MTTLPTTGLVISALGGNQPVAKITHTTGKVVSSWRAGKFPANSYLILQKKLRDMGLSAPDTLWAMRAPGRKKKKRTARAKR